MADAVPYLDLAAQLRPIRAEIDAAIARTLDNSSFCLGPEVKAFEEAFARHCGVRHALGFNSGTSALHVAMRLLGVGPGDEVITTPFTFVATAWAIVYVGAKPVFADIDEATFNLDPQEVQKQLTAHTKAVLPVHLYGHPCDMARLIECVRSRGVPLVEDAAQAIGARYRGQSVGTFGQLACFSFYPAKNLGACGEGGALVTNDDAFAARAKSLREHGSTVRYHHDEVGYNYRMEGLQGAVLNVKLKRLEAWTERRREIAQRYRQLLEGTPLRLPMEASYAKSAWHLYVVRHPKRDKLKQHLEANQIGCAIHYPVPLHLQKCFAELGHRSGDFPVAERAARECLCLPIYPELTDAQVERVATCVRNFFGTSGRD